MTRPTILNICVHACLWYSVCSSTAEEPADSGKTSSLSKVTWIPTLINQGLDSFVPAGRDDVSLCTKHGKLYKEHLHNLTLWAVQMFDASSRGPSGLLTGNNYQFGDFDECIRLYEPTYQIRGKYVVVNFIFWQDPPDKCQSAIDAFAYPSPEASAWEVFQKPHDKRMVTRNALHWALCVPESCQDSDITRSLVASIAPVASQHGLAINVTIDPTFTYSSKQFTEGEDLALTIFIAVTFVMVGLVIVATIKEVKRRASSAKCGSWVDDMSIISNWKRLVRCDNHEFPAISGMKTWSMFLIIYGHRMMLTTFSPMFNQQDNELLIGTFVYTLVRNGALVVNTFLVITGFLTYHKIIKDVNNNKPINVFKCIYHRWVRLTPLYAYVMALAVVVGPRLSFGGPLGRTVIWDSRCSSSLAWLTQLLYINNYVYPTEQCLIPSWYLAVDMQLYIVCALCGYVLWCNRRAGLIVLLALTAASVILPGIVVFQKNYNGVFLFFFDNFKTLLRNPEFVETYMYTHNRASPYVMGMLAAYVYNHLCSSQRKWSTGFMWILLVSAILVHVSTWLGAWLFYLPQRPYYLIEHVAYAILHRVGWSLPICVYIICAAYGRFGVLRYTIGARRLRPLSTLSYAALLIHTPIQLLLAGSLRSPPYYNMIMSIWMAAGDLLFSYCAATLLYLFIEAPLTRLKDFNFCHLLSSTPMKHKTDITEKQSTSESKS